MPRRRQIDRWLLGAALLTAAFGVMMVASASGPLVRQRYDLPEWEFAWRQGIAVVLGIGAMLAATFVPLDRLTDRRTAVLALGLTWVALVAAYLQPPVSHTHRWLQLPIGSIQPSALAKLTLPLGLAGWLAWRRRLQAEPRLTYTVAFGMTAFTVLLVLLEPDLGSAVLLFSGAIAVLWLGEAPWRPLAGTGLAASVGFVVAVLLKPYRLQRILDFFRDTSYQVQQSLIALGAGGVLGRGPGESSQKLFFLPQPHSDFIFAIVGEELGFLGATGILLLLAVIVAAGLRAAARAGSHAAALLAAGVATTLGVQVLLNVSVCLKLLPAKGLPLPLVSAGGSDVVMTMLGIGLLLNVGKEAA